MVVLRVTERSLAVRFKGPVFPPPSKKSSALVPPSALPLDELFEQCFPLILARRQARLGCASFDVRLRATLRAYVRML